MGTITTTDGTEIHYKDRARSRSQAPDSGTTVLIEVPLEGQRSAVSPAP